MNQKHNTMTINRYCAKCKIILIAFLIFVCFFNNAIIAQEYKYVPFPTKNAIWSEMFYYFGVSSVLLDDTINYNYVLFDEDTVIANRTYQKLYRVTDTIPTPENAEIEGYIRVENKKVYIHQTYGDPEDEELLYDFNAQEGDVFYTGSPVGCDIKITKIDTIEIYSKKRKRFHIEWQEVDRGVKWIEGIGSTQGLLWPSFYPLNQKTELLCLHENNELMYYNNRYGTCYPKLKGETDIGLEKLITKAINIYPNPATTYLNIQFDKTLTGTLEIYNTLSQKLCSVKVNGKNELQLNVSNYNTGVYTLILKSVTKEIVKQKFIVE